MLNTYLATETSDPKPEVPVSYAAVAEVAVELIAQGVP